MLDRHPLLLGTAAALALLAPLTMAAAAGPEGPYVGLVTGGLVVEDAEADGIDIEYDTGFAIGGQLGFQFSAFRLEGEFAYQLTEGLSETGVNSDVNIGRFTIGAYADLPLGDNLAPYVGGGFGIASLRTDDAFDDQDSAFTWHGEVGLGINVTGNFLVSPFYRYEWIDTDLGGQSEPLVAHLFGVSLRYVLPWRSYAAAPAGAYRSSPYDSPYGSGYTGYRRYDHYYDRDPYYYYPPPRRDRPDSPAERERDRCGWKGPGCEDGDSGDWRGG